ncbi:MAG: hypothetical protein KDC38_12765 [Planctomycetes bacterium]|nr:hypothetical protein [Planctomycetota bacterium]
MRNTGSIGASLAVLFATTACLSSRYAFPSATELGVTGRFSERELDDLDEGRTLAAIECAGCHRMTWPGEYRPEQWPRIIEDMGRRGGFSEEEVHQLTFYYQTVSAVRWGAPTAR